MFVKAALILFLVIPIIGLILFGCVQYERLAAEAEDEAQNQREELLEDLQPDCDI